jgi:carbonic anhydrase/acetyltransferase-like protein (isoleucine patch superfamily)
VIVGGRTSIQDGTVVHATPELATVVGAGCVVGHLVHLEGCEIEDSCLIGSNSVVLHRATIRTGATVAASAVVTNGTEVPAGALAIGIPATIKLGASSAAEIQHGADAYAKNAKRYRAELRQLN